MKKAMRKMIPAVIMLLISAMLVGTSTYAWFSMNRTVTVTGMQVQAKAEKSLVISTAKPTEATADKTVAMTAYETALKPATHKSTVDGTASTTFASETGLQYVSNPTDVNPVSGKAYGSSSLTLADVTTTDYYHDYVVYISSSGGAFDLGSGKKLVAKLSTSSAVYTDLATKDTWNAVSVDFYVSGKSDENNSDADVSDTGTYKGTLNLKRSGLNSETYVTTGSVDIVAANGTIPANSASDTAYLKVTMRVYFDGALPKDENTFYIRNQVVDTNGVGFTAIFDIVDVA